MQKFTIEISDKELAMYQEYIELMEKDVGNNIKNVESAIEVLARLRVEERLVELRK